MNTKTPLLLLYCTNKQTGYDECAPAYLKLREHLEAPSDNSQTTVLPWLKNTFNTIGAVHAPPRSIPQDIAQPEAVEWFVSAENTMPNATDTSRKMDFGMRTHGPVCMPHDRSTPDFGTVEVVGEHTAKRDLDQQKWIQFAGYARFVLYNQLDRLFIFGLLIHKSDCYLAVFLNSCIIVASPFPLSNLVTVIRVVAALHTIGPIGRGRDVLFTRVWTEYSGATSQKPEETRTGYVLEFNPSKNVAFKLKVIGHLYRRFALLGRRTHVALCRVTSIPEDDPVPNFCLKEGDYAVIKISAIDTSSTATEAQLYAQLSESGARAVPLVAYAESGGGNEETKDILGSLWEEIVKNEKFGPRKFQSTTTSENSIVNRQRRYLVFATVGIPLISLALEPADLCNVMINILKGLETYAVGEKKVRLLHRDISPSNILVSVSKGSKIFLDNKKFVYARESTRWAQAQAHESIFAGLFDLDLACKQGERTNLVGLTGHTAYLAPSVILNWGSCRHYHQDITSLFLCFAWMLCMPSLVKDEYDEFEVDKPPSSLTRYGLRSSSLRPAGTGYIPHARTFKVIKRTKPHPLYRWADPRSKEKLYDCANMIEVLRDSINESYKGLVGEELYDLFDKVSIGELSWQPNRPLQRRLHKLGGEYDKAAHDEYLILMNNRAPLLVTETTQLLVNLAEVATRNQTGKS